MSSSAARRSRYEAVLRQSATGLAEGTGDFVQGTTLPSSRLVRRNDNLRPDAGAFTNIVSFGEDAARNVYIVDFDGEIFMLRAS